MSTTPPTPDGSAPRYTPEVARRTADVLERVRGVVPEMEWPVHAPYVDAIREWKAKRNAVVLAHNYQTPEIFHGVSDLKGDSLALARMAAETDADVIVMDDGLQNPSLAKTASFAVLDAETAVGNGRVIPAGPLRARLDFQLRLADAIVLVGGGRAGEALAARAQHRSIPVFRATMSGHNIGGLAGQRVVGFAGIAQPEKFFASLQALGAEIVAGRGFPDHHPYSENDAKELLMLAGRENALLVSTEKDLARLKGRTGAPGRLAEVTRPLQVSLIFDDAEEVVEFLRDKGALANHGEK